MKETNIVVSPHLDDAVHSLGCFLSMNQKNSTVVTVFAGMPIEPQRTGWDTRCGFKDSTNAVSSRRQEDKSGLNLLCFKNEQIIHLNFFDGQYRQQGSNDDLHLKEKMAEQISIFIDKDPDNSINLYGPLFLYHGDHFLAGIFCFY